MTDSIPKEERLREELKMPADTRKRLFNLRCRSKRGEYLSPEDTKFLMDCYQQWPTEYSGMQQEVLKATAPFGSRL